jgi:hypothetical protein
MTNRQAVLLAVAILAAFLLPCVLAGLLGLGWFMWRAGPFPAGAGATPAPSAFYTACQDLNAVEERATAGGGFTLATTTSSGSGSGSGPGKMNAHVNQTRDVQCRPGDLGKVLPALKAEFQKLAAEKGLTPTDSGESTDPAGNLIGFTLSYATGAGHGKVEVTLGGGKPAPGKAGINNYPLTVKVEESVP